MILPALCGMQEKSTVIPKENFFTGYFVASGDHFSAMLEYFQVVEITVLLYYFSAGD